VSAEAPVQRARAACAPGLSLSPRGDAAGDAYDPCGDALFVDVSTSVDASAAATPIAAVTTSALCASLLPAPAASGCWCCCWCCLLFSRDGTLDARDLLSRDVDGPLEEDPAAAALQRSKRHAYVKARSSARMRMAKNGTATATT